MSHKEKIYTWTADHSGLPLAQRFKEEGHGGGLVMIPPTRREGKLVMPKTPEEVKKNAERINYLKKNGTGVVKKLWADEAMGMITKQDFNIWDQIYGWQYAETLFKRGIPVLGGSKIGYKLETERRNTLMLFKKLGFDIPPYKSFGFHSAQEAIKFLKAAKDEVLYVFKSDNPACDTMVAEETNDELIQKVESEKSLVDGDGFILQEKKNGIEMACESWYFNGKPIMAVIDLEGKKKYNEHDRPQTGCVFNLCWTVPVNHSLRERLNGPMDKFVAEHIGTGLLDVSVIYDQHEDKAWLLECCGCFDPETEALTNNGWKKYSEISLEDRVLSINPETKEIAWKSIKNIQVYPYIGDMVAIGNNGIKLHSSFDAVVTPNHNWLVQNNGKHLKMIETHQLKNGHQILRVGKWKGFSPDYIEIPEYVVKYMLKKGTHLKGGRYGVFPFERKTTKEIETKQVFPVLKIDTQAFMQFIGIYLAEGSVDSYYNGIIPRRISISQTAKCKEVEAILKRLPFNYTKNPNGFRIASIQLGKFLYDLGLIGTKSYDKFIPPVLKEYAPLYLKALLNGFIIGDGHITKNGYMSMTTTSPKLADDLQEIIHKIGWVANISKQHTQGTDMAIKGRTYKRNHNQFTVSIRKTKTNYQIYRTDNQNLNYREIEYNGIVWCLEVDDWHTFFVRRNGKAYFSGNSRPAYNEYYTLLTLCRIPLGEFHIKYLRGEFKTDIGEKVFSARFAGSVRVFNNDNSPDRPIMCPDEVKPFFWCWDCYKKDGQLVTTGGEHGESLGIVTGTGENPAGAMEDVWNHYKEIYMPTKWARMDFKDDDEINLPRARYDLMKSAYLI